MDIARKGVVVVFICSIKPKIKTAVIVLLGIAAAVIVTLIIYFNFRGETWVMAAGTRYSVQAGENEERVGFLRQFGWEVEPEPVSVEEVVIPAAFNQVYRRYNELQKAQGLDLEAYAGKTVKKVVYRVTNYQRQDTVVHATLLIYRDRVIGGDISSAELDGFMYGFAGAEAEENGAAPDAASSGIQETVQQPRQALSAEVYPTD